MRKPHMYRLVMVLVIALSGLLVSCRKVDPVKPAPLRPVGEMPLGGVHGRIDHLSTDVAGMRLFVAALGNNSVEVLDLKSGQRIRSITGLRQPQGTLYVPDANRLVV